MQPVRAPGARDREQVPAEERGAACLLSERARADAGAVVSGACVRLIMGSLLKW